MRSNRAPRKRLTWVDQPPPKRTGTTPTSHQTWSHATAAKLRARPGEWAMVGRMTVSYSAHVKNGDGAAWQPPGAFDACVRDVRDGRGDLYVRYVGTPDNTTTTTT